MKILWLCNGPVAEITKEYGISNGGISWIDSIIQTLKNVDGMELSILFPISGNESIIIKEKEGIKYFGFSRKTEDPTIYDKEIEDVLKSVVQEVNPDSIHIFGTEFPHTLSMIKTCQKLGMEKRVVISIQGLCYYIAKHYCANLPAKIVRKNTFRDFVKHDNIQHQKRSFEIRGEYEKEALELATHVIGRTGWDKACAKQINKNLKYYTCNENMRSSFYENQWEYEKCEKYSIFISQSYYPLKGFHHVLEAAAIIKRNYKDIRIYTTGKNVFELSRTEKLKESSYSKYIRKLISDYGLKENVIFLGFLSEKEMCERYLKSNVFVSASSIENSSNSVAEAMLLGMPIVASAVGGIPDMLEDKKEGYLYQSDASYMLAHYIMKVFEDIVEAKNMGVKARKKALHTHDRELNNQNLIEIYKKVINEWK